jgi:hypothetical protein
MAEPSAQNQSNMNRAQGNLLYSHCSDSGICSDRIIALIQEYALIVLLL